MKNNKPLTDFLGLNPRAFFLLLTLISCLIQLIIKYYFFTDEIFYNTYASQITRNMAIRFVHSSDKYSWSFFLTAPLMLLISVAYDAALLYSLRVIRYKPVKFRDLFNICLKAAIVFGVMQITRVVYLFFFARSIHTLYDLSYIPFSLTSIWPLDRVPRWAIYPVSTANLWEVVYCVVGGILLSRKYQLGDKEGIGDFFIAHFAGLIFWLIVVTFFVVQFT